MIQNPNYILRKIHNIPYLLPVGQLIAEHRRGVQLNETGACLWNMLSTERSLEELVSQCAQRFEVPDSEIEEMRRDICHFTDSLIRKGLLLADIPTVITSAPFYKYINIAGQTIALYGPEAAFSNKLDMFYIPEAEANLSENKVVQTVELCPHIPFTTENGRILLRNRELCVMEGENKFVLFFPTMKQMIEVHISKDASSVKIYCAPLYDGMFQENLFHILRHTFIYLAQRHGMFALHSASILYKDKAWLFTGPSGTGKTTHTALWREHLHTPVLNGDLNLLALENGIPVIHGLPWCGTSEIYTTGTYPVGGIVLLKQAGENSVAQLSDDQTILQVCNRLISPVWTTEQLDTNLTFVGEFTRNILVRKLFCTRDKDAVSVIKAEIDSNR